MRHIAVLISLGFMAGFLFCFFAGQTYKLIYALAAFLLGIVALVMAIAARKRDRSTSAKRGMAAVFMLAMAFAGFYNIIYSLRTVEKLSKLCDETVIIEGMVISSDSGSASETLVIGKANGVNGRFKLDLGEQFDCGSYITAEVKLSAYSDIKDIIYNYAKGIYVNADYATLLTDDDPKGIGLVYYNIMEYRDKIIRKMVGCTSKDAGILLTAMFCGDTSQLPSDIRLNMNRCGVGHLLAISGFHVSIIAVVVAFFFSKLWINRTVGIIVSEFIVGAFVVFSGMKVSSIRAYIMLSILLMAYIVKKEYDAAASVSVCVLIMTLSNPYIVVDPSFLLSITGVFGAATAASSVKSMFRVNNKVVSALIVSTCTAIIILPISACFFDEISIVSPITNLIFIPISSAILTLCTIFAIFGGASIMIPLVKLAGYICDIMIKVSAFISSKPVYIPIRSKYIPIVLVCLGVVAFIAFAVSGNVRRTAFLALILYSAALVIITAAFACDSQNVYVNVTAANGDYMCVVYSGKECIVINSGRDFSSRLSTIQSQKGLSSPLLTIAPDDENRTFYRDPLSVSPYDPDIMEREAGDGDYIERCEISFAGLDILAEPDYFVINGGDKRIAVCNGYNAEVDGDIIIYVFGKISIIKSGKDDKDPIICSGYYTDEYLIGRK